MVEMDILATKFMNLHRFIALILLLQPCLVYAQEDAKYINDDVTSIYSTHPDRPFRYGFPYEQVEVIAFYHQKFDNYGIDSGLVVAEVGAASGWLEGIFSVFSENVTYYVQDIDTNYLNKRELNAVVTHFSKQRSTPQTNTFQLVIGDMMESKLPIATFDLIILNNTFHEFSEPENMIRDLAQKLKPNGRIVLWENFSNPEWTIEHNGCNIKAYQVSELSNMFEQEGLFLTKAWLPEFAKQNYLTFEKDAAKGQRYQLQQESLSVGLKALETLHSKKILKDDAALMEVLDVLMEESPELCAAFPNMEIFFHDLAEFYLEKGKHDFALEVLNALDLLFPKDEVSELIRGDVYYDVSSYEEASEAYEMAIEKSPEDVVAYTYLLMSFEELSLYEEGLTTYERGREIDSNDAYLNSALGDLFMDLAKYSVFPFSVRSKELQEVYPLEIEREDALRFALDAYNKAILEEPLDPDYLEFRANVYLELEEYENAIKDYNRILYLSPYSLYVYRLRAEAKLNAGDEAGYEADLLQLKKVRKELKK